MCMCVSSGISIQSNDGRTKKQSPRVITDRRMCGTSITPPDCPRKQAIASAVFGCVNASVQGRVVGKEGNDGKVKGGSLPSYYVSY